MVSPKLLVLALLVNVNPYEVQHNKIKQTVHDIKLVAYSTKKPKDIVEEVQRLIVKLSFEVEELDGK